MDSFSINAGDVAASRIESSCPIGFRFAQYPSGARMLQGAFPWSQGFLNGFTWKDIPTVLVDVTGKEIP